MSETRVSKKIERRLKNMRLTWQGVFAKCQRKALSFDQLCQLLVLYRRFHNHSGYEKQLRHYDPTLHFTHTQSTGNKHFLAKGKGKNTLNTYRSIYVDGKHLFEKIYLKDSDDFQKSQYFYKEIFKNLDSDEIKVPQLVASEIGNKLCVEYFEYIDFEELSDTDCYSHSMQIINYLAKIPVPDNLPIVISDYTREPMFQHGEQCAIMLFNQLGHDGDELINLAHKIVASIKNVCTHGDLLPRNVKAKNILLDWDKFGIYPIGYEFGYSVSKNRLFPTVMSINEELVKLYEIHRSSATYEEFEFSYQFFALVFFARRIGLSKKVDEQFLSELAQIVAQKILTKSE